MPTKWSKIKNIFRKPHSKSIWFERVTLQHPSDSVKDFHSVTLIPLNLSLERSQPQLVFHLILQVFTRSWCVRWLQPELRSLWTICILSQTWQAEDTNNETKNERKYRCTLCGKKLWCCLLWWIFVILFWNLSLARSPHSNIHCLLPVSSSLQFGFLKELLMCQIRSCPAEKLEPAALMGRLWDADWRIR